MEKFGLYYYRIDFSCGKDLEGYTYTIYQESAKEFISIRESNEWFESRNTARLAAIGHISLLENGEG